jgi:hypothetical protein
MPEIDVEFQLFESIVKDLSKHLFPTGKIQSEASSVEAAFNILNNNDIGKYLTADFIKKLKEKLHKKAQGIMKQAEIDKAGFAKFSEPEKK